MVPNLNHIMSGFRWELSGCVKLCRSLCNTQRPLLMTDPWLQRFCLKLVEMWAGLWDSTKIPRILNVTSPSTTVSCVEKYLVIVVRVKLWAGQPNNELKLTAGGLFCVQNNYILVAWMYIFYVIIPKKFPSLSKHERHPSFSINVHLILLILENYL